MSVLDDYAEEEVVENPTLRAAYNLAPLHQNEPLHWDYEVHLIGEKIYDKTIHLCEICDLPILVYGRMLPCKHVFCFDCARKCDKTCRRCKGKVQKLEKSALGTVYVCTFGAPKHSHKGCRRTYLSQRDLQSHHGHRHLEKPTTTSSKQQPQAQSASGSNGASTVQLAPNQLPLTQQQAQQQAAQQKQQTQHVGPRGLMSPSQQMGGLMPLSTSAQSSPLIPGLGGLGTGMSGQASPLMQPSVSPKPPHQHQQQQAPVMGMAFPGQPTQPAQTDVFRPLDIAGLGSNTQQQQQQQQQRHLHQSQQLQHQQQGLHMAPMAHMQQSSQGIQPSFGQAAQFQGSSSLGQQQQQQMGMHSVQSNMIGSGSHLNPMIHQQQQLQGGPSSHGLDIMFPLQNSQQIPASSPDMSMAMASSSQSRTNVNLITVPIQDEGQFRPLPYVNSPMVNQANVQVSSFNPQACPNPGSHSQNFPQQGMSATFSPQLGAGGVGGQSQNMMPVSDQSQNMTFNQGQGNPQGMNLNQGGPQGPPMSMNFNQTGVQGASPRMSFNQPGSQTSSANMGFNQPGLQPASPAGMQAFNQGLRMNQLPGMAGGAGAGNMPRNLAGVVQAINLAAAVHAQGGNTGSARIPSSGAGGNNRFPLPPGRWPSPHGMQPRLGGNNPPQPRPHDGSFNQGPYYN